MELKNINEFINESYTADYLAVIINKLKSEGKSSKVIYTYLDILNIPAERIIQSMASCGCAMNESQVNEGDLDDLVDDIDDETEEDKEETEGENKAAEKEEKKSDDDDDDDDDKVSSKAKSKALAAAVSDIELVAKAMKAVKGVVGQEAIEESLLEGLNPKQKKVLQEIVKKLEKSKEGAAVSKKDIEDYLTSQETADSNLVDFWNWYES